MLINEVMLDEKILIITPEGALKSADFERLTEEVDPYIEAMGPLNGLMIYTESFSGWENFAALLSHMKFVKEHHHNIKKVAAVTDSGFLSILPRVANYFVQAEVKHFSYKEKNFALDWLKSSNN
ncbi:MAG: STAS/SEC14 domain-containing protein [Desulfuromonadales bacterium]